MITSIQNPRIQKVRTLISQSKERKRSNHFVIEGVRLSEEAMDAEWDFDSIFFSENLSERGRKLIEKAHQKNIFVEEIPFSLMKKISDTETPQGILCVLSQKKQLIPRKPNFILICDSIRDPGNLGTIFRSALAANVQVVFVSPNNTDIYSPKVIRAGMGAHFHMPILQLNWTELREICEQPDNSIKTIVASADGKENIWEYNLTQPIAIIIGSEATGPGTESQQLADSFVKIPMLGSSESLNAATAASIILFEVVRQRWK